MGVDGLEVLLVFVGRVEVEPGERGDFEAVGAVVGEGLCGEVFVEDGLGCLLGYLVEWDVCGCGGGLLGCEFQYFHLGCCVLMVFCCQ